jgi:hypothetical protein
MTGPAPRPALEQSADWAQLETAAPRLHAEITAAAARHTGAREERRVELLCSAFAVLDRAERQAFLAAAGVRTAGWSAVFIETLKAEVPPPPSAVRPDLMLGHPDGDGWQIAVVPDLKLRSEAACNACLATSAFGCDEEEDLPEPVREHWVGRDEQGRLVVTQQDAYRHSDRWVAPGYRLAEDVQFVFLAPRPERYSTPHWRAASSEEVYRALLVAHLSAPRPELAEAIGAYLAPAGERPFTAHRTDGRFAGCSDRFAWGLHLWRGERAYVRHRDRASVVIYRGGWQQATEGPGGLASVTDAARAGDPRLAGEAADWAADLIAQGERPSWGGAGCLLPGCADPRCRHIDRWGATADTGPQAA